MNISPLSETNMSLDDVRRESAALFDKQQRQIDAINENLRTAQIQIDSSTGATNFAGINNILDDSLPEWSTAAYDATGVLPSDAGDNNLEAKNWYRQLAADTLLAPASATALKTAKTVEPADHSLWAANEGTNADIPRWNKTNAYFELGGVTDKYDIYYPIPNDIIFPGQRFTFQLEAMLRTVDALPADMQMYVEFYDNTAGQRKIIEGGSFTITDENGNDPGVTYGIPGSTSIDYQVLARTDSGEEAISNVLNFPNAPVTFDQNNRAGIKFSGVAGFIEFEIYKKAGTTYVLQFTVRNTIDGVYYDVGNPPEAFVSGFPSVTNTKPKAFALTTNFVAGTEFGLGFVRNAWTLLVPTTYDRSVTGAGMQYLRIGLTLNTAVARQILIRKLGLSMGDGNWARSPNDTRAGAHSTPSNSGATGSPSGGGSTGGGDGGVDPPPPTGGGSCVLLDTLVRTAKGDIALGELRTPILLDGVGPIFRPLKGIKLGHASRLFHVRTEDGGHVACTYNEPFITSRADRTGTWAEALKKRLDNGESVYTLRQTGDEPFVSRIVSIDIEYGSFTVGEPTVEGGLFVAGGFVLHNKPIFEFNGN